MGLKQLKKRSLGDLAPWLVLGAAFSVLVLLNLFCLDHWLDSDMAAEMIFSKLLADEKTFLATDQWYYSTEFRVLYTQLLMEPLFFVCQNWHVIRAVTNILTYLLLLGSYFYMVRPLGVGKRTATFTAVLYLLPFSETFVTHVHMGNTYMPHMILIHFVFGMLLRLAGGKAGGAAQAVGQGRFSWKRCLLVVGYLLLCLVCGLSGVRYLLALQAPLVLACVVCFLQSQEFAALRKEIRPERIKALFCGTRLSLLAYSVLGAAFALAGYVLNAVVIARAIDFQTYEVTNFISVYQGVFLERLQNTFGSILMLFGYIPEKGFLSLRGAVTLSAFVLLAGCFLLVARTGKLLGKPEREDGEGQGEDVCLELRRFLRIFLIVAFALNTFVFVFTTSTIVPRYYLTVLQFIPPLLAVYYEEEKLPLDRVLVGCVLCLCLLLSTTKCVFSFITTDKNADKRAVCEFLQEEGYHFGYATYWNGNIMTELTNGAVEVANIHRLDQLDYFYWSSPKKYYEASGEGKTFLLLSREEQEQYADEPVVMEGREVYADDAYVVYHFDSIDQFQDYREAALEQ